MIFMFRSHPDPAVNLARVRAFNRAIDEEAPVAGSPVVNLLAQSAHYDSVFDLDSFQPNEASHREIWRLLLEVMLPALDRNGSRSRKRTLVDRKVGHGNNRLQRRLLRR